MNKQIDNDEYYFEVINDSEYDVSEYQINK